MWDHFKKIPKMLLLGEIATFLVFIAAICGLFLLAYGFVGNGTN